MFVEVKGGFDLVSFFEKGSACLKKNVGFWLLAFLENYVQNCLHTDLGDVGRRRKAVCDGAASVGKIAGFSAQLSSFQRFNSIIS